MVRAVDGVRGGAFGIPTRVFEIRPRINPVIILVSQKYVGLQISLGRTDEAAEEVRRRRFAGLLHDALELHAD